MRRPDPMHGAGDSLHGSPDRRNRHRAIYPTFDGQSPALQGAWARPQRQVQVRLELNESIGLVPPLQHLRVTSVASAIIPALRLLDAPRAERSGRLSTPIR